MLALIGNLSLGEFVFIAVLAVLIFGKNLPQVLGQLYAQLMKVRRSFDQLRRDSGIDRELRNMNSTLRDVGRETEFTDPMRSGVTPTLSAPERPIVAREERPQLPATEAEALAGADDDNAEPNDRDESQPA